MVRLTDILDKVKSYHASADTDLINKAYVYAARMHEGQTRRSGDPYFIHPVSVADIIADMRLDTASICAALLHDVVEDTEATEAEVTQLFGSEVAFLVDGVTKLGRINFTSREDRQAESFRKMLVAMAQDIRVLLVKLADRLDNMRTLEHMKIDAQERIATETMEVYAPLAGRLGIHWLKAELEDLSFQYTSPEAHKDLAAKVKHAARDSEKYITDVTKRLQRMMVEKELKAEVSGRVKHLLSIYRKLRADDLEFEQLHDFLAFRVLVDNISDCYAALGVVHSQWTPVPGRFKDYIALPKPNMYQSLHTTVIGPGHRRIEIQMRTHDMHRTAEQGIAAHWEYKEKSGGLNPKDAAKFAWLRQLMEFQKDVEDPVEFFESVKVDLFPDEVYVFTPKGDVKTFSRGATPIDFAFAVHSEVGNHCTGARINGSIVPLRYKLHNGDVVEILTSTQQHPNKAWLDFVVTGRARSKIRAYLRDEQRKQSIKLGKTLLERELHRRELSFARFQKAKEADAYLKEHGIDSHDELCAQVGYGRLSVQEVVNAVAPPSNDRAPSSLKAGIIERTVRKVTGGSKEDGIRIEGMDGILVRYARCCNPLPGDAVLGWITRGRGVTVHRRGCPKAMELDTERRVDVQWTGSKGVQLPVSMRVVTADKPGILAHVSAAFTDNGVNIAEANCRTGVDGKAVNIFQFSVTDVTKLKSLMRIIQKIDGVYEVERT